MFGFIRIYSDYSFSGVTRQSAARGGLLQCRPPACQQNFLFLPPCSSKFYKQKHRFYSKKCALKSGLLPLKSSFCCPKKVPPGTGRPCSPLVTLLYSLCVWWSYLTNSCLLDEIQIVNSSCLNNKTGERRSSTP